MKVIRETCVAGLTIDRTLKITSGNHSGRRGARLNITSEKVQKNNDRLAVKNLMRLLNANFGHGDLHIVLTYKEAPGQTQAKKDRDAFIKKMRRAFDKDHRIFKYVAVTEFKHARIHHHMVIPKTEVGLLEKLWAKGWVKLTTLDTTGNYCALAEYLIKETTKTMRAPDGSYKRRYASSTNLVKPVVKKEIVDIAELFADPEPIKGYYIPKDYNRRFEHPVTGLEHLEYIMVALGDPRKYRQWPKGTIQKTKECFKINYSENQERLF